MEEGRGGWGEEVFKHFKFRMVQMVQVLTLFAIAFLVIWFMVYQDDGNPRNPAWATSLWLSEGLGDGRKEGRECEGAIGQGEEEKVSWEQEKGERGG